MRRIEPINLPDAAPADLSGAVEPEVLRVSARDLHVDDAYQRNLSARSIILIRRIVSGWDWTKFKPPVVTDVEGKLHVIDGQHTAIAAATHGGLDKIPVMLVVTRDSAARADAFVGHNRDRLNVTPQQVFHAQVVAGDEDAQTIAQVCVRAGVSVLRIPPPQGRFKIGETQAIETIRALVNRRGAMKARIVLQALVAAKAAPIGAAWIKAADQLLYATEYAGTFTPETLTLAVRSLENTIPAEAVTFAAAKRIPLWRALVVEISRRKRHARAA